MATQETTPFVRWTLNREETVYGSVLSPEQVYMLQNDRANIAEQLLALKFDPLNPTESALAREFLQGQLSIVSFIIERASEAQQSLQGN